MYISTTILGKKMYRAGDGNLRTRPTDCHIRTQIDLSVSLRPRQSILSTQFTLVWIVFFCIMTPRCGMWLPQFRRNLLPPSSGCHNPDLQCREN
jgi:hypothetical protein